MRSDDIEKVVNIQSRMFGALGELMQVCESRGLLPDLGRAVEGVELRDSTIRDAPYTEFNSLHAVQRILSTVDRSAVIELVSNIEDSALVKKFNEVSSALLTLLRAVKEALNQENT